MPTELEELVGFIANPNPQIRKLATENLVPYSISQPSIFKADELLPVKHLKFLIRDHPAIAEHAMTMLINLTADSAILEYVAADDRFIGILLGLLVDPAEPNANLLAMLLANLTKWEGMKSILDRKQDPPDTLKSDQLVLNQLLDLFVKGNDGSYNKHADFDYLAYVFADLSKHADVRQFFINAQDYDGVIPLNKIKVFTEHKSDIRRKGVASTIKNVAFDVPAHAAFLDEDKVNILPYILLPITGNEEYDEEEMMGMLPDLQLLPPDKRRDPDHSIVQTHVETLTLLTTTRAGRELMRSVNVYPIIRETHLRVDDEGVREACERLVQVLMRDEAEPGAQPDAEAEDEDNRIVEI
ncbi:57269171-6d84-47f4-9d69-74fbb45a7711 [Thermothielavioides terrestris]|uniref:Protein HGH1 homolog n=1 Tax=Thermothielavioides terrestris TaxID=2587410 RepID=A0A446BM41_9PEZI|nr:57269171-6d84-47f4-9d69-74fbb45a7711 [Thermothielavioides terrestris]